MGSLLSLLSLLVLLSLSLLLLLLLCLLLLCVPQIFSHRMPTRYPCHSTGNPCQPAHGVGLSKAGCAQTVGLHLVVVVTAFALNIVSVAVAGVHVFVACW